ncbi:MAG: hypothetical protein F2842_01500 [Actinobacteria bacterium]|nr:hypothetical protein [Actinomycetota bacterium]
MTPREVRALLEELATRIDDAAIVAGIRVVGGAALSILDHDRRSPSATARVQHWLDGRATT